MEQIKEGDSVILSTRCMYTEKAYSISQEMKQYEGTVQTVCYVSVDNKKVTLEGMEYNWHIKDMKKIERKSIW